MRIVLNNHIYTAGSKVCIYDLQKRLVECGITAVLNDWDHYENYDVAVFMGYDEEIKKAREQNPQIRIAIADPKESRPEFVWAAKNADFLMVSSVEQRDVFYKYNRNIMIYYMFPEMKTVLKEHKKQSPVIIGYHGNKEHLEGMFNGPQLALNELAIEMPIEFWAMYNYEKLGRASIGLPDEKLMKVRHIQWSEDNYYKELSNVDIGIVPNCLPFPHKDKMLEGARYSPSEIGYYSYDHLVRFKSSSNAGRIHVFAKLGIPVVSDFYPSAAQFIIDGYSGFLASSPEGWFEALLAFAESPELRVQCAGNLKNMCELIANEKKQIESFIYFCHRKFSNTPLIFKFKKTPDYPESARKKNLIKSGIKRKLIGLARRFA